MVSVNDFHIRSSRGMFVQTVPLMMYFPLQGDAVTSRTEQGFQKDLTVTSHKESAAIAWTYELLSQHS